MTRTEALKLSRHARAMYGTYRVDATHIEIACPLDVVRTNGRRPAHRVTVWHNPWEKVSAKMIDAAFVGHFCTEYDDERCEAIS